MYVIKADRFVVKILAKLSIALLGMSNFYYSGWPEEANGAESHNTIAEPSCPLPPHVSTSFQFHGFPSWSIPIEEEVAEDRGASASKSHSQAEKRRRDRINSHLSTLRKLIPKSEKMDKAALLGSVIDHVKDLKRKAMEAGQVFTVPTEVDEVTVEYGCCDQDIGTSSSSNKSKENIFIKASVCCDDRPELFSELIKALNGLRLTTVRADMASLGGRTKSILVLCTKDAEEGASVSNLKQSLRVVLSRIASSSMASNFRISSKRQRFFLPSNYSQC